MNNELTITFEGDYIQVLSNGDKNLEFAQKVWSQTVDACKEHNCYKVLVVASTKKIINTMEAFGHGELFQQLGITHNYRIAWVELNPDAFERTYFIETILSNRGLPGRLFSDVTEAKEWLLSDGLI